MEVTQEEIQEWRDNKITKYLFSELNETKELLKDYIAEGNTLGNNTTAEFVGQIKGINQAFFVVSTAEELSEEGNG